MMVMGVVMVNLMMEHHDGDDVSGDGDKGGIRSNDWIFSSRPGHRSRHGEVANSPQRGFIDQDINPNIWFRIFFSKEYHILMRQKQIYF